MKLLLIWLIAAAVRIAAYVIADAAIKIGRLAIRAANAAAIVELHSLARRRGQIER